MRLANTNISRLPILEKLFCVLIVLGSGTLFTTEFSYVYYALVITFALLVFSGSFRFERQMMSPIIVVFSLAAISALLNIKYMNGDGISSTINNYLVMLCSILFSMNKEYLNKQRLEMVIKCFFIFSLLSTVLFVLFSFGVITVRPVSEVSNISTYNYLLNVARSDLIDSVYRNGGIYWEPGMYQVFLNFVLVYVLFNKSIKHRLLIVIYLLLLVTLTISVSGYVLSIIVLGLYALGNSNKNRLIKIATMGIILAAFALIIPIVSDLLVAKQDTGSFGKRSLDLLLAWDVFKEHPILGQGIVNNAYEMAYLQSVGEYRPSSNGLMNLLMGTGLLGAFIYFFCYTKSLRYFSNTYSKLLILPLLLWFLISINTEPIQYEPFVSFLFGIGLAHCYK